MVIEPMNGRRTSRFRFRLSTLLLVMLVTGIMAAAGSYAVRAFRGERSGLVIFVVFTVVAPPLVVILASHLYRCFYR